MSAAGISTFLLLAAWALAGPLPAPAQGEPEIFIRARRIYPVSSTPLGDGQILVRGGRIAQVGKELAPPHGARIVDVEGTIVPGFIDCGSNLAVRGRPAEEYYELTPAIRVADALDLDDDGLRLALLAGVTLAAVTPGDRNVVGGLGAILSTAPGSWRSVLLKPDAFLASSLTSAAFEENRSLRSSAPYTYFHRLPTTRMGTVFLMRRALYEALDMTFPEGKIVESHLPPLLTPAGKKVLAESARGGRPVRVRANEKEEILTALRTADEFEMPIILEGFLEGIQLIPEIARRGIPVLLIPGATREASAPPDNRDQAHDLARHLAEAGVLFGFFSQREGEVAKLRERVAVDMRFGLSEEAALKALTLDAARILKVDDQAGSLEPGKRADLVALSGDPFAVAERVEWVMSGGRIYRERDAVTPEKIPEALAKNGTGIDRHEPVVEKR
ncbi:MAG: amidohydrolase family protein [Planctomycetes bacterium]|nr:amidohydrolase family protein [Planctomycetota bacterium]